MATYWPKICEFFLPHSHLTPSLGVNPFEFSDEPYNAKTSLSVSEDFVILACVVLIVPACDRQTDRQTDIPTMAIVQGSP